VANIRVAPHHTSSSDAQNTELAGKMLYRWCNGTRMSMELASVPVVTAPSFTYCKRINL
jgi:hypothetical protein